MSDQVWLTDRRYRILGTVFRVVTQDAAFSNQLDRLLGDFETTERPARAANIIQVTGAPDETHRLYRGCHRMGSAEIGKDLLPTLIGLINRKAVGELDHFATHAAVLKHDGRTVAFPAESGGGKSTLAAAAILVGFSYLSDEALIIDDNGLVVPYPKPLALSQWSCESLGLPGEDGEKLFNPDDLGGYTHQESAALTDVVIASYGHDQAQLEAVPASQAVAELLGKSFNHYKNPEWAFRLTTEVIRSARVWRLSYSDPREAIRLLTTTLVS